MANINQKLKNEEEKKRVELPQASLGRRRRS
jgi:hypothetical protein